MKNSKYLAAFAKQAYDSRNCVLEATMQGPNTILEDISAEIGYTATNTLAGWFGGTWLRVPCNVTEDHTISKIIGFPSFQRLVQSFPGETLFIPKDLRQQVIRRNRMIFDMLAKGKGIPEVSAAAELSERQVKHIRRHLEEVGVLPLVAKAGKLQKADK